MSALNKRARSDEQKLFRRQQIMTAATELFHDVGYDGFSMALLAERAGVVKGTLYLYFKTREEVFLALYDASLVRWSHVFIDHLDQTVSDLHYAETLYDTAFADGNFVPLQARLEKVIEHNVSIDQLVLSKRNFLSTIDHLSDATAFALDLSKDQATEVIKTMGVLLVGVAGADLAPSLTDEDIPSDIRQLIQSFSSRPIFIKNAHRIIQGIRHDALEPEE
jgi:AcrR family transcriptional regulator